MSLTEAILPSLRDRHLAGEAVEASKKKVKVKKLVVLGKSEVKKKGKK